MISIILPVFNAQKYIQKAIDSILAQTYKDFEVIIIDDGATDGTGEICQDYAARYDNIRYIKQMNSGVCAARNRGIAEAKGEFIAFCDHDDEYKKDYLEKLVKFALDNNLNMAKCGAEFIDIDRYERIRSKHIETFEDEILDNIEVVKKFFKLSDSYFDVWNGIYKTKFLKESGVMFNEKFVYGMEDYDFNTRIISCVPQIGFLSDCMYIHYMRMNQSTSGRFKEDRLDDIADYQKVIFDVFEGYTHYLEKDWKAISFGKNLIGVIKYSVRGRKNRKTTVGYIKQFSIKFEQYLEPIKMINLNYKKYSLLALLAKYKKYNSIYFIWILKFYMREVLLLINRIKIMHN